MKQSVLSPLAIAVRDQVTPAVRATDTEKVREVCAEVLEVNTLEIALDSVEMKAVVGSVVEGVLAALASSRAEVIEMTMHAIARFASTREGSDPTQVASVICDAAGVIEVSDVDRQPHLDSLIQAALAACDHLLGPEREELAEFLRSTLPMFLEQRTTGIPLDPAQRGPDEA